MSDESVAIHATACQEGPVDAGQHDLTQEEFVRFPLSSHEFPNTRDQVARLKHEGAHAQALHTEQSVHCAAENEHAE